MNDSENSFNTAGGRNPAEFPDPLRMEQARERVLHAYSVELLIKKTIWWVCIALEIIALVGSMIVMFLTGSHQVQLLCVVIALIAHEGMVVVVLWSILTSLRMDMLRELKSMELQLAEMRVASGKIPAG